VLHLNAKKRGSQEQQLLALAERMRARGTPLTYVFARPPVTWLTEALSAQGVELRVLDYAQPWRSAARLWRALSNEGRARPALVHFHYVRASSPLIAAARLAGARVIVNDHVTLTRARDELWYETLKRARNTMANPLVDLRLCVSGFVAESVARIEHVDPARICVVENGIDLDRFAHASPAGVREELGAEGRPLVVCVSRLSVEKGVETLIRALPLVGRDVVLALVGDGPMEARWRALAGELGIADRVRFLGLRDDVERLVAACDVAVVPSQWDEAFGQAVTEGMAAGKPVVVTRSGAMPEILGDTGLVVPKRDSAGLARAIGALLDDPQTRARLGKAAQARAREHFGLDRWVDRMVAVYERVLS
jgi:glycosyltransferase involved in cell wall biosynthesis